LLLFVLTVYRNSEITFDFAVCFLFLVLQGERSILFKMKRQGQSFADKLSAINQSNSDHKELNFHVTLGRNIHFSFTACIVVALL